MPRPPHEHLLYRLSSIGRPVDPRFATNKAIMMIAVLAFVAGFAHDAFAHGVRLQGLAVGGSAALTAFLTWALGRELDPDRNATAFIAVALGAVAWVVADGADLWPLAVAVATTRVVNRTVGPPARITDAAVIIIALGVAAFVSQRWSLLVVGAVTFVLDGLLTDARRRSWIFAGVTLALLATAWQQGIVRPVMPRQPGLVGVVVGAYLWAATTLPPPRSPCDIPRYALDRTRVQAGMLLAAMTAMLAQLEGGRPYPAASLLGVLAAVVVGRVFALAQRIAAAPTSTGTDDATPRDRDDAT